MTMLMMPSRLDGLDAPNFLHQTRCTSCDHLQYNSKDTDVGSLVSLWSVATTPVHKIIPPLFINSIDVWDLSKSRCIFTLRYLFLDRGTNMLRFYLKLYFINFWLSFF
jgi:hypothetical protein